MLQGFSRCFQVFAGIFESVAIIISILTVTKYGIQKNIFYNILIAGICLIYIAIFPNAEWTLVVFLAMLGKTTQQILLHLLFNETEFCWIRISQWNSLSYLTELQMPNLHVKFSIFR